MKKRYGFFAIVGLLWALCSGLAGCGGNSSEKNQYIPPSGSSNDNDGGGDAGNDAAGDVDSDGDGDTDTDTDGDGDGDGGTINGVPPQVNDFMNKGDMDALVDAGMNIHRGDTPPDITGTYYANSRYTQYDSTDYFTSFVNATYVYSNQTQAGAIDMSETEEGWGTGTAVGSYISGTGQCFTVWQDYTAYENVSGDDCNYGWPLLVSGCLVSGGISGFQYGFIMKKRDGTCDQLVELGHKRIIYETDDLVDKTAK